jgi:alpha-tubulin suppressor-like RCC1 family protein
MGLRRDGTVELWSRLRVNRGPRNCIAIASGWKHYLALGQDGSVKAWGSNYYGQCNVPEELK